MPSFDQMKNKNTSSIIGYQIKEISNMVYDEVFSNSTTYRVGKIYDCNMNEIYEKDDVYKTNPVELEFRFVKTKTFTVDTDLVEYWVQFKTGVNPEIDFDNSEDQKHRLGYYIDILDDNTKEVNKWLIVGKDESEFDRYNVLKCNWLFEWLDHDRNYHKCVGCLRDQNSYNSGIWSSDFSTTVEDQMKFIVPANDETKTIDYNIRFMLSDNDVYPKTYEISKVLDTFPIGVIECTLAQTLFNQHTDLCGKDFEYFGDNSIHRVCDFYKSSIKPNPDTEEEQPIANWTLTDVNEKLYVNGQPQTIKAIPSVDETVVSYDWHLFIDNEEIISALDPTYVGTEGETFMDNYYSYLNGDIDKYYLQDYFDISIDKENNTFTIAAINKDMVNYIIKIAVYNKYKTYYDFVEMEVCV